MPRTINKNFSQAFSLVKYNLVLFLPFFMFLLVIGFLRGSYALFIVPAVIAVFLSGWLNMFKQCTEMPTDENLSGDKRTEDSFLLFREFFPGVGKYFVKITFGILIYFILFYILMFALETLFMSLLGEFDTFSRQDLIDSMKSPIATTAFWSKLDYSDKIKIFRIAGLEALSTLLFFYFTMFWMQIIVIKDSYPLKALLHSFITIIKDPVNTFIIFISGISSLLFIIFVGAILSMNPLFQLLILFLFVFIIVYFVMVTFIYLERSNSSSRTDSLR